MHKQVDIGAATRVIIVLVSFVNSGAVLKTRTVCVTRRPRMKASATLLNCV